MKTTLLSIFLFTLITLVAIPATAQSLIDPATNSVRAQGAIHIDSGPPVARSASDSTVNCDATTFWGINLSSIVQFSLSNGVLTQTASFPSPPGTSLAFCNNLNGGSFSPLFYSATNQSLFYDDNGQWNTVPDISNFFLNNAAGSGDYLYFLGGVAGFNTGIIRYQNSAFTQIFYDSTAFATASIAADSTGNVWFFGTDSTLNSTIANYIKVVSPTGQVLQRYNIDTINTDNAYGSFFLNGVLYMGLGASNYVHPNTLIPYAFSHDSALMGTPISMPDLSLEDLASCTPGTPLSVPSTGIPTINTGVFGLYPNPAACDKGFSISSPERGDILFYDALGRMVYEHTLVPGSNHIQFTTDEAVLFYRASLQDGSMRNGKVVIEK